MFAFAGRGCGLAMLSAEGGRNVAVGDDASVALTQHRDGDIVGRGHDIAFVAGVAKNTNCVFAVFLHRHHGRCRQPRQSRAAEFSAL